MDTQIFMGLIAFISFAVSVTLIFFYYRNQDRLSLIYSLLYFFHGFMYLLRALAPIIFPGDLINQAWLMYFVAEIFGYTAAAYLLLGVLLFRFPKISPNFSLSILGAAYLVVFYMVLNFDN